MSVEEADEHLSMSTSFIEVSEDQPKENSSAVLQGTRRILYNEGNETDGDDCNSDIDLNEGEDDAASMGAALMGEDSESNCDVDEHSDMMYEEGSEQVQASPPKMNPINFDTRNVKMIISSSSLNTVPEVSSCGALSSGTSSVDQQFMSPDLLAMKTRAKKNSQQLSGKSNGPCFRQPLKNTSAKKGFSIALFNAVKELNDDGDGATAEDNSDCTVPSVAARREKHHAVANEAEEQLRHLENIN